MAKAVTFFNKKGGTGKTSLAFSIAKDMNYALLSNDDSVIEEIYPHKAKIVKRIEPIAYDTIYDLGGCVDSHIITLFKASDVIVVPTLLDINSIKRTINTVVEVNRYCENIVVVINRVEASKLPKYKQSIEALKALGKPILSLRESEAMTNSIHQGKTISELYHAGGLSKCQYASFYNDYAHLLHYIEEID